MQILEVLLRVISKLEELRIPYMVSGSAASSFYAFVRTTQDGDMVVALGPDQVEKFASAFAPEFYLDRASIYRSLQMGGSFNLIHLESSLKIDFFPLWTWPICICHSYQRVFRSGLLRIFSSWVTRTKPSARAVAPMIRSAGSRG